MAAIDSWNLVGYGVIFRV